jgi:hypothetical protein
VAAIAAGRLARNILLNRANQRDIKSNAAKYDRLTRLEKSGQKLSPEDEEWLRGKNTVRSIDKHKNITHKMQRREKVSTEEKLWKEKFDKFFDAEDWWKDDNLALEDFVNQAGKMGKTIMDAFKDVPKSLRFKGGLIE